MAKENAKRERTEVIGTAEFGAFMHRNNGGKVSINAYTAVNKKLQVDAADETTRIAHKRFRIMEEEVPELDGNKFYSKDVWTDQKDVNGGDSSDSSRTSRTLDQDDTQGSNPGKDVQDADRLWAMKKFDEVQDQLKNVNGWVMLVAAVSIIAIVTSAIALFH